MKLKCAVTGLFFFALLVPVLTHAQIPNAGFEDWTGNIPNGWTTSNTPLGTTITPSTTVHGGTQAARGEVVAIIGGYTIQPVLQSGSDARGFSYAQRPVSFTGYYQFSPAASSGDRFGINVALYKGGVDGTPVASAAAAPSTAVTSYTQFNVPFVYLSTETPDTCIIQIQIVGPGTGTEAIPHVGSSFLLDDLAFAGATYVVESQAHVPANLSLNQNYPNPFNPTTNISFTVPGDGRAKLRVYNLMGQEVTSLFEGSVQAGRMYRLTFNGSPYPSGVYFSKLEFVPDGATGLGAQMMMRKMVLIK